VHGFLLTISNRLVPRQITSISMKWIKHDTDANQDAKLQNVMLDYGLEGYGLYWYCIELIAGKIDKDNITFDLEHDARIIARNTGCTAQKVEEMMRYFVDVGLFENSQGVVTCLKLARRLDKSMTSNPEMRSIIENFKSHDSIMTKSENVMQDKIRLEDIKETDRQANHTITENAFQHLWAIWKKCKAGINVTDTSPKAKTFEKTFKKIFNAQYFKSHTELEFKAEINAICDFCKKAHSADGFNRFENMQLPKFLNEKQWRD